MTLREKLTAQFNLTDADFGTHASDLYVRCVPGMLDFLKAAGLPHSTFIDNIDGVLWVEIPFQNAEFWNKASAK